MKEAILALPVILRGNALTVRGFCEAIEAHLAPLGVGVLHLSCGFSESAITKVVSAGSLRRAPMR